MSILEYVDLSIDPDIIGSGSEKVSPQRLLQFVEYVRDHICFSKGYLFSAVPTASELCKNIRAPNLHLIPDFKKALMNIRANKVSQSNLAITTKRIALDPKRKETCPLFSWLNALPPVRTHFRIPFCEMETFIQPALEHIKHLLFIDRYLKLDPVADDTKRLSRWIHGATNLTQISIIREKIDDPKEFLVRLNEFAKMIPTKIHAKVIAIRDKGKAAFHGRYIHADQFTIGIEAGLDKKNDSNKKTDIYLLNRDDHWNIDKEFVVLRSEYFQSIEAWEKKPGADFKPCAKDTSTFDLWVNP